MNTGIMNDLIRVAEVKSLCPSTNIISLFTTYTLGTVEVNNLIGVPRLEVTLIP